jgi:dihydroorotase
VFSDALAELKRCEKAIKSMYFQSCCAFVQWYAKTTTTNSTARIESTDQAKTTLESMNTEQTSDLQNEHIDSTDKSSVASGDIVKK